MSGWKSVRIGEWIGLDTLVDNSEECMDKWMDSFWPFL